jgi:hypothetical protein
LVEQSCQLLKFVSVQKIDVHHINKSSAVVQLFFSFVVLLIKTFQILVAKSLADCIDEGFKVKREGGSNFLKHFRVSN